MNPIIWVYSIIVNMLYLSKLLYFGIHVFFLIKVMMFVKIFLPKTRYMHAKVGFIWEKKVGGNFDVKKVICISHSVVF